MEIFDDLDRIEKLGFSLNINWNKSFDIVYEVQVVPPNSVQYPNDIRVLSFVYVPNCGPDFLDIIETSCDFFYEWYNKNLEKIKKYELDSSDSNFDELTDSAVGDITKQVYRDFNIGNILD